MLLFEAGAAMASVAVKAPVAAVAPEKVAAVDGYGGSSYARSQTLQVALPARLRRRRTAHSTSTPLRRVARRSASKIASPERASAPCVMRAVPGRGAAHQPEPTGCG